MSLAREGGTGGLVGNFCRTDVAKALWLAEPGAYGIRPGAARRAQRQGRAPVPASRAALSPLGGASRHSGHRGALPRRGSYSEQVNLSNALHEAPREMASDPFLERSLASRKAEFGCNTRKGYLEEDAAQALDQLLATGLGLPPKASVTRWLEADDGLLMLALLLHDVVQRGGFAPDQESYADFLARAFNNDRLWAKACSFATWN